MSIMSGDVELGERERAHLVVPTSARNMRHRVTRFTMRMRTLWVNVCNNGLGTRLVYQWRVRSLLLRGETYA